VLADLKKVEIPLPSLPEQRWIADILDQADVLRAKRRTALARLDALTQSVFLDMFGDPSTNPLQWPEVTVGDVTTSAMDGPHVSPIYADAGIPFISTRNVRRGEIIWQDLKFISPEEAEIQWRKCKPVRGDILYTKGGTTGLAAVVDTADPFAVWVHVAVVRPDHARVSSLWLEAMLNSQFCYQQSQRLTHGIANRDLGLTRMVKIRMFLPPKLLQDKFVARKTALDALISQNRLWLAEAESLFASLRHRAFAGEL
jgi:type I restriction enzyme S subunit